MITCIACTLDSLDASVAGFDVERSGCPVQRTGKGMGGGSIDRHFRTAQLQGSAAHQSGNGIHGTGCGGQGGPFTDIQQDTVQGRAVAQCQGGVRSRTSQGQRTVPGDSHLRDMAAGLLAGKNHLGSVTQIQGSPSRAGSQRLHRSYTGGAVIPSAQRYVSAREFQRSKAIACTVQDDVSFRGTEHGIIPGEVAFHGEGFRTFLDKIHMVPADGSAVAVAAGVNVLNQIHHGVVGGRIIRRIRHDQRTVAANQVADFQAVPVPGGFRSPIQAHMKRGAINADSLVGIQRGVIADIGVV